MVESGIKRDVTLNGSLYLTNSENTCGNILTPPVTNQTFPNLKFLDTKPTNQKLIWDIKSNNPTNYWQKMVESNKIKDYTLPTNTTTLTKMKNNGVFCFYIPTYVDEDSPTCDFTFPQVSQSYVIVNRLQNPFGPVLTHYIVVTPDCYFYKPCSGSKPTTSYNILHKTRLDERKAFNENKEITINGKKIKIINSRSHYNPTPTRIPVYNKCRYYCKCSSSVNDSLELDPIYQTTNIFTDLEAENCGNCLVKANNYCKNLNKECKAYLVDKCLENNDYTIREDGIILLDKMKGKSTTNISIDPLTGKPVLKASFTSQVSDSGEIRTTYNCVDGACLEISGVEGEYTTLEACLAHCTTSPPPPDSGGSYEGDRTPTKEGEEIDDIGVPEIGDGGGGVCDSGFYWCESAGGCIKLSIPCEG
jgi:hypothetical protein